MPTITRARHIGRSTSTRKVVTYRSGHFTGFVPSQKNGRVIKYESILERDYIQLVEADPEIESYTEQPEAIEWSDGIDTFKTTFDFAVEHVGGARHLIEVKPLSKVTKYRLDLLYGFARAAALKNKYAEFELWTDRELKAAPRLGNAELAVSAVTTTYDPDLLRQLLTAIRQISATTDRMTLRELRSTCGESKDRRFYWPIVALVAKGSLVPADPCAPLDDRAVLIIPGARPGSQTRRAG